MLRHARLLPLMLIAALSLAPAQRLATAAPAARQQQPTALIPRALLFGNPERANPQLSADGTLLAYLAPDSRGVLQVWVRTIGAADDRMVTADDKRGIRSYFWSFSGTQLIYLQDKDGDESFHFYVVDIAGGAARDLTPYPQVQAQLIARNPNYPDTLLVGLNITDRRKHDVYRLDLTTGELTLVAENPGNIVGGLADAQFQLRAALAANPDGSRDLLVRSAEDQPWAPLVHWGAEDAGSGPIAFSQDGNTLYLASSLGANAQRLVALDLTTGAETVIAADPQYDLGGVLLEPRTRALQAVAFYRDRLEWQPLDPTVAADFAVLAQVQRGDFGIASRDFADRTWLVTYVTDDGPTMVYVYDRATRTATLLFSIRPALEALPLAQMQPVAFPARDGLQLHGYLTTPVGVPATNLPAVLLVHGGPWVRDSWGFNPEVQWLANRGYAVLQVNFRGSTGYGKDFVNAGDREWGAKMEDDLVDGVRWLVQSGVADPARVGIFGGSYGGYAVLAGLVFAPEVFAVGVEQYGISDLVTLRRHDPPEWTPIKPLLDRRVGNPDTDTEFLNSRSPINFVDRIQAPLLVGQGANDVRVPIAQSDMMVDALRAAAKPVEYVVYADEGHGFARPPNRLHFYSLAEEFLARYLGGRAEPTGEIPGHAGELR